VSALTIVWGDPVPQATIESHRRHDPDTGRVHESYLWDCECGARGQAATIHDAKAALRHHRVARHLPIGAHE
jgi:hypothetical protein